MAKSTNTRTEKLFGTDEIDTFDESTGEVMENEMSAKEQFLADAEIVILQPEPTQTDAQEAEMWEAMEKNMQEGKLQELTGSYLSLADFRMDEKRAYIFGGLGDFTKEDGTVIPSAKLKAKDGTNYVCAAAVITGSLSSVEVGRVVVIQCFGKKKSAKGSYYDAKVFLV